MPQRIPLARPNITQAEIDAVVAVLKTPQLSLGPSLTAFEEAFAHYCGTREAIACSSGTAALHLVVEALGVGPGDEVVTTPFSFIASANCVLMAGAKPVFVDINPDTWNIDPALIQGAVTEKTRLILPVHVFGQVAEMDPILTTASRLGLAVVEDACEALASRYKGRPAGSLATAAVFGFYPNKQITTGEGGMILTDDAQVAGLCRSLRNQGREPGDRWLAHARMGYNYRLSDINCALGLAQLGRIDEIIAQRRRVERLYDEQLCDEPRIRRQRGLPDVEATRFVYVVRLDDRYDRRDRDRVLVALVERGIECSDYFPPIHLQPFYVERFGHQPGDFPVCEALANRTIALPFHHELTESDVDYICGELRRLL